MDIFNTPAKNNPGTIADEIRYRVKSVRLSNIDKAEIAEENGDSAKGAKIRALNDNLEERALAALATVQDEAWWQNNITRLDSVLAANFQFFFAPRKSEHFDTTMVITGVETDATGRIVLS